MIQHVELADLDLPERVKKKHLLVHNYNQDIFKGENKMPAKKEEITVEDLQKEVAALKKEVAALKKELKAKSGGVDPRLDALIENCRLFSPNLVKNI